MTLNRLSFLIGLPSLVLAVPEYEAVDPDQDYFADGMVDEITTALSAIFKSLFVIARHSSFTLQGQSPRYQAGREANSVSVTWL